MYVVIVFLFKRWVLVQNVDGILVSPHRTCLKDILLKLSIHTEKVIWEERGEKEKREGGLLCCVEVKLI